MMFEDPSSEFEKPVDDLDKFVMTNWMLVPEDIRRNIVDAIREKAGVAQTNKWKDQYSRGMKVGSDDPWFHFSTGMAIRNACRNELLDDALPFVKYDDGNEYQNWDDFYGGMLQQLASEV